MVNEGQAPNSQQAPPANAPAGRAPSQGAQTTLTTGMPPVTINNYPSSGTSWMSGTPNATTTVPAKPEAPSGEKKQDVKNAALGSAPMLERTRAEIARKGVGPAITYTIDNVDYDGTIEFHKNDLSDDQYGIIMARAQELGSKARQSIDKWVFTAIHDGGTNKCYDNLSLFNDADAYKTVPGRWHMPPRYQGEYTIVD